MPTQGQTQSDTPAFTITELTGDKRVIKLLERALPYRPIEFDGDQRMEVTWFPGNPQGNSQMYGPSELPSEMSGWWKDKYLSDTPDPELSARAGGAPPPQSQGIAFKNGTPVTTCADLVDLVDDVRRKGARIEVQWGHIIRRGHLRRLRQRWHNTADCQWTMIFEWTGQADSDVPAVLPVQNTAGQVQGQFQAAIAQMKAALAAANRMMGEYVSQVTSYVQALDSTVGLIDDTVSNAADTTISLVSAARRVGGVMSQVQSQAQDMVDGIQAQPGALAFSVPIAQVSLGDSLAADSMNRQLVRLALQMARNAAIAQADLAKQVDPDLAGIYIAKEGDDLRDVAREFYGSSDDWTSIMVFNDLTSSKLEPGMIVYVPQARQTLAA